MMIIQLRPFQIKFISFVCNEKRREYTSGFYVFEDINGL